MNQLLYTGIGSRSTPQDILDQMTSLSKSLKEWTLRSGGADGADTAFERGATLKEIYLPWKGFNNSQSELYEVGRDALKIAETIHPNWEACQPAARNLHGRNCYQVLGKNLRTPSCFVVCWTENGKLVGGTTTAIKLATIWGIPVFNLAILPSIDPILSYAATLENIYAA